MRALVADQRGAPVDVEPSAFPNGAALVADGVAWVSIDGPAASSLGPALAWALGRGAHALELVAETDTGLLARRAEWFDAAIRVWFVADRTLLAAVPEPLPPPPAPAADHLAFGELIESGGADVSIEHGVVSGEVRGLEVCRVVDQPTTGNLAETADAALLESSRADGLQLEVGVGAADREAFQLLHGDIPTADALSEVVSSVTAHRSDGAPQHPLNRLARERYLRWLAVDDPSLLGLRGLHPVDPPVPRRNLRDPAPCVAAGTDREGGPVTVVFSSGVDLDLLPFVADVAASLADQPPHRLLVALPARDLVPVTRRMADLLRRPIEFAELG